MACRTAAEVAAGYLSTPCTVLRATRTPDGLGGTTTTYATHATTVCHVASYTDAVEAAVQERLQGRPAYRLRLPFSVELVLDDKVVVDGRTFDVVAVQRAPQGSATLGLLVEASAPVGD